MSSPTPSRKRVLVLAGPSGAGKSRLAKLLQEEHGWPVVELDDFYRDVGDPSLPMSTLGLPDWDDVRAWNQDTAVAALDRLCTGQSVDIPVYDISVSKAVDSQRLDAGAHSIIVAEGIFAAHIIADLEKAGLLAGAWCVCSGPWVTFWRRFSRDTREHRKPISTLWRRGHRLRRAQPAIVADQEALGAVQMDSKQAMRDARALAALQGEGTE